MNKKQKELLLKEKKELEKERNRKVFIMLIGLGLIFFSFFTPGIFLAVLGFAIIFIEGYLIDKEDKRIKEIKYKLAGTKEK